MRLSFYWCTNPLEHPGFIPNQRYFPFPALRVFSISFGEDCSLIKAHSSDPEVIILYRRKILSLQRQNYLERKAYRAENIVYEQYLFPKLADCLTLANYFTLANCFTTAGPHFFAFNISCSQPGSEPSILPWTKEVSKHVVFLVKEKLETGNFTEVRWEWISSELEKRYRIQKSLVKLTTAGKEEGEMLTALTSKDVQL